MTATGDAEQPQQPQPQQQQHRHQQQQPGFEIDIATAVADCDRLLIVAAAGLSISLDEPNNPYHNPHDFALHYPTVASYGYRTAYDAMGLAGDERVPAAVRVAFTAQHFLNMRFNFKPTPGYAMLHRLASSFAADDVFTWTSNVDGAFERAGFDPERVYQTQGEMRRYQCARPGCGAVWDCVDQLRAIEAATVDGALTDLSLAPRCTACGSAWPAVRPNLRGGEWFDHKPYEAAQRRLLAWLDECVARRERVAILEVGVGPNTPVVTRIPACAFASAVRAAGGAPVYLRVNPDRPERAGENPAAGVPFFRWQRPWTALAPLVDAAVARREAAAAARSADEEVDAPAPTADRADAGRGGGGDPKVAARWQARYHDILLSLRTPR